MSKVFLSASFSGEVDEGGRVNTKFRQNIEAILGALRHSGFEVFCALEDENWNIGNEPPRQGVKKDLGVLHESEALLALVSERPSAGVQIEIGYSMALGKPIFIATEDNQELGYFNQGAIDNGWVTHIKYGDSTELAHKFKEQYV